MASPSLSATLNFVKKYPITLCGFSLLFMPSVHRLLLYFTPLLLSTAIFIVAMMSWGPNVSSEKSATRRSKPKLVSEHHEWAFNENMGMDDDDDEEEEAEEEEVVGIVSHAAKAATMDLHKHDSTSEGKVELDVGFKPREELRQEPDPDLSKEGDINAVIKAVDVNASARTSTSGADCQAAVHGVGAPTTSSTVDCQVAPMDNAATNDDCQGEEPHPDLQGEDMGTAYKVNYIARNEQRHSACPTNDGGHAHHETHSAHVIDNGHTRAHALIDYNHGHGHGASYSSSHEGMTHADDADHGHASHTWDHHQQKHLQEGVPSKRPDQCLQVCA